MKKVLFVNYCAYLPGEKAIKRTFFTFQMMRNQGIDAHFLTSDFNHYEKKSRNVKAFYREYPEYRNSVHFVHMKPYKKNISVGRFVNNYECEKRLFKWITTHGSSYNVIYISLPTYYITSHIREWCDNNFIKLVIDVNDLWPDSLKMVINNDFLYSILSFPFLRNSHVSYANADAIVAVSKEYLNIANKYNVRAKMKLPVYIGSMLEEFDAGIEEFSSGIIKPNDEIWITYIGTLGRSYDFNTVIGAIKILNDKRIRFKVLGQGPEEERIREYAKLLNVPVDLIGFLDYGKMAAFLSKSDICVNCIKQRASQSIINKAADYFASGKPVINCGPCKEMANLIHEYHCGENYIAENSKSCADAINKLITNPDYAFECGINSRRLAELKFDRLKTHQKIIEMIMNIE